MSEDEPPTLEDRLSGERAETDATVSRREDVSKRKATGAFYTPPELADFVVDRGLVRQSVSEALSALDPSVGGGVFLDSVARRFDGESDAALELVGVDIEARALSTTEDVLSEHDRPTVSVELARDDFFRWRWSAMGADFDLVVGNPPWGLTSSEANESPLYRELALDFVHHGVQLLDDRGCLSLLLPGTWVFSRSDTEFRDFLLGLNRPVDIYRISPDWFPDATFTVEPVVLVVGPKEDEEERRLALYDATTVPIAPERLYELPFDRFSEYLSRKFPIAPAPFHRFVDGSESSADVTTSPELGYRPYSGVKTYDNATYVYDAETAAEREASGDATIRTTLDEDERTEGVESDRPVLVPYDKGGRTRDQDWTAFWVPVRHYLRWDAEAVAYYRSKGGLRNEQTYFTDGIHFSSSGRNAPVFRLSTGLVYDADYPFVPVEGEERWELLSLLNSPPCMYLIEHCINPTAHFKNQDFEDVPLPSFRDADTDGLVEAGRRIAEARKGEGTVPTDAYRTLSKEGATLYGMTDEEEEVAWNWFERARLRR